MDTLIRADIFFFITSLAVVIITIAVVVALIIAIKILRDIHYVSRRVRERRYGGAMRGFLDIIAFNVQYLGD